MQLKGAAENAQSKRAGTYILGPSLNQINDNVHWIQEEGTNAIWYDKEHKTWRIGPVDELGGTRSVLKTSDDAIGPHVAKAWKYYENGWIETTDLVKLSGIW